MNTREKLRKSQAQNQSWENQVLNDRQSDQDTTVSPQKTRRT